MRLELISPFVPVRLLVGSESLILYVEYCTVFRQVQRGDVLLTLACTVTKDIQSNRVQPLLKVQYANLACRRALEGIISADESFLNDVFGSIRTTHQAQGK